MRMNGQSKETAPTHTLVQDQLLRIMDGRLQITATINVTMIVATINKALRFELDGS